MADDGAGRMELVYKEECPYCLFAADTISRLDAFDAIETTPIESARGRRLVEDHHGEYVESPHLFTDEYVYYGVIPVAKALPKSYLLELRRG